MNTYIDAITYSKAPTGLNLTGQIGNIGRIQTTALGATSLVLVSALTTAALNQYDSLYITDGPSSEVLQVGSGGANIGTLSIPLQTGTAFAHAGGAAYVTDGAQGSLGQSIFEASRWIEDICYQALWSTAYTGEILTMPTMRAAIDNQQNLHFRPRHFPITTFTSISLKTNNQYSVSYDSTQAIIDADQQTVDLPVLAVLTSGPGSGVSQWFPLPFNRQANAWITLAYTAGFAVGQLPMSIQRACTLLVNETFSQMTNPLGLDDMQQGKRKVTFTLRGDQSGESLLVKQAHVLLAPYVAQSF